MFKSGDSRAVEHGSELENTKNEPCIICMTVYTKSVEDQTDHFTDVCVSENVAYGYDVVTALCVRKYTADAILFREIQCKKRDNLIFSSVLRANWAEIR